MKRRISFSTILRRSFLVICAVFCFAGLLACSDDYSSSVPSLSDVFARDVDVVYDGRPHSVSVVNTLPSDTVTFSTDNIVFSSSCPAFSEVGYYTVFFKVLRSGYAEFSSSAYISISPCVLPGISASDLSFVYDGLAHSVVIDGTLPSDAIAYSTDGISFSSDAPTFSEVGVYAVYYRVSRPYGEYKSSCSVTVLPDIYGRYFNPLFGVIVISRDISFSVSGSGVINDIPFSVTDNVLTYNSFSFSRLSDDDFIYRLSVSDCSVYFTYSDSGSLSVSFKDNTAEIFLDDDLLLSLPRFNYCESGVVVDYNNLCFTQAFSSSSAAVTDISVVLSVRSVNPISVDCLYFSYDGLPHGFGFSVDVIFLNGSVPAFTDVGSYTVPVVFTSSVYLPKLLDCTLVILPDLDGVFVSSEHVLQISDNRFSFDGTLCGELSVLSDSWAYNDLPITVTDVGIVYDGIIYSSVRSPVLAVYIDGVYCSYILVPSDLLFIRITYESSALTFSDIDKNILFSSALSCAGISVSVNDIPLTPLPELPSAFSLGPSDLLATVGVVRVETISDNQTASM